MCYISRWNADVEDFLELHGSFIRSSLNKHIRPVYSNEYSRAISCAFEEFILNVTVYNRYLYAHMMCCDENFIGRLFTEYPTLKVIWFLLL